MPTRAPLTVLLSAGEVSGDVIGARLAAIARETDPDVALYGAGGTRMAAAGVDLTSATDVGVVGISEAFSAIPSILRTLRSLRRRVQKQRPDAAVLIGNDAFNVLFGYWLRRRGVATVAFFPPQVWVWRAMLPLLSGAFDSVLAAFPDEAHAYARAGARTVFVGHYLADALHETTPGERADARRALGLRGAPVIALLPGSRRHEVTRLADDLAGAAVRLRERYPDLQVVVAAIDAFRRDIERSLSRAGVRAIVSTDSHAVLRSADVALCCSGTATLESALLGVPLVAIYRTSATTYALVRLLIAAGVMPSATVALPNLILGRSVVPELTQRRLNPASLAAAAEGLLSDGDRRARVRADLREVRRRINVEGSVPRAWRLIRLEAERVRGAVSPAPVPEVQERSGI